MSSSDVALSTYLYCDGLKIKKISPTILEVQPGACRNNTNQNDIILNESIFLDITKSDEFGIYDGKRLPNSFYGVVSSARPKAEKLAAVAVPAPLEEPEANGAVR